MSYDDILYETRDGVATITINRPDKLNAFSGHTIEEMIDALQDAKTVIYRSIVEQAAVARPGVLELMDEAIAAPGIAVGICSAATRGGFEKITDAVVGRARLDRLDVGIAGDDVERKRPDPQIYDLARARLGGLDASKCVVIEDSLVGLRAARKT